MTMYDDLVVALVEDGVEDDYAIMVVGISDEHLRRPIRIAARNDEVNALAEFLSDDRVDTLRTEVSDRRARSGLCRARGSLGAREQECKCGYGGK